MFGKRAAQALCLCGVAIALAEELACTAGRMFLSAVDDPVVHVYDLDSASPQPVKTFAVVAPGMLLYSTDTRLARVAAIWGGNVTTGFIGKVQFFWSGISVEEHGDHVDVVKAAPRMFVFELSGYRPTHFTASAGYLGVFFDGVWVAGNATASQPSSASFLLEMGLPEGDFTWQPTVTSIAIPGGAHHGVAYALGRNAFILSQPTSSRANFTFGAGATPNGFMVHDARGNVLNMLNDPTTPPCVSLHGAASIGSDFVFGCSTVGLLKISYNSSVPEVASRLSSKVITYPSPVLGRTFRSSYIDSNTFNGVFVGNFIDAAGAAGLTTPAYMLSLASSATSVSLANLAMANTTAGARACNFVVDMAAEQAPGGGTFVATLGVDGAVAVTVVGRDGLPTGGMRKAIISANPIVCTNYTLVAGYGAAYVLSPSDRQVFIVDLQAAYNQLPTAVSKFSVPFRPRSAVVSLPQGVACQRSTAAATAAPKASGTTPVKSRPTPLLLAVFCASLRLAAWA